MKTKSATTNLHRTLGLPVVALYGLGNILGAGIYVLVGKVAGEAGYGSMLAFIIAMTIAALTAFSYMELAGRYPASASVSVYLHKAFGKQWLSVGIGLAMVAGGIASAATLARGFAGYLGTLVPAPAFVLSLGLLVILGLLALRGIGESAMVAGLLTLVEVLGLVLVITAGWHNVGNVSAAQFMQLDPMLGFVGVMNGAFLAFYAFIGFEDMVNVAEETKNPQRTMPLAILVALVVSTVLYLLVVLVALSTVNPTELAAGNAPLSLVYARATGGAGLYLAIIGIVATVNGVIVQIIMGSRIVYGLSKRGWLNKQLADVDSKSKTPVTATVLVVALMGIATVLLPLVSLARLTSLIILVIFGLVNAALIVIKKRQPNHKGLITVPKFIPYLGSLSCALIILFELRKLL